HLVDDLAACGQTRPVLIGPVEGIRVDDGRWTTRSFRLRARCRIRECIRSVEAIAIVGAWRRVRDQAREIAVRFALEHANECSRLAFDEDLDALATRSPHAKVDASIRLHFCADRQPPLDWRDELAADPGVRA